MFANSKRNRGIILSLLVLFLISLLVAFYWVKGLIPQYLITAWLLTFLRTYQKTSISLSDSIINFVAGFFLYTLPAWAVTGNLTLALLIGTLWSTSPGLTILVAMSKQGEELAYKVM